MNAMPAVQHFEFAQPHVPGLATYDYVRPTGAEGDLPLLLLLHGGDGGEGHLQRMLPMLQYCWQSGDLPACVCVTPKCGMSYYLNYRNGQENWEDLVVHGIPEQISRAHGGVDLSKILIAGISMGGTGTLRMAFRYPSKFIAAAAMEPGVEEAFDFTDIPARNTFWRAVPFEVAHGEPVDSAWWAANNIAVIARSNSSAILTSGL